MKDRLAELSLQLFKLKKGEKVKFDVFYIIPKPLADFIMETNKKLSKIDIGFIEINNSSICVPHISLAMGYVDSYKMLEDVFVKVGEYVEHIQPVVLDPVKLYLKGVSPSAAQYLFVDFKQNNYLIKQKSELEKKLNKVSIKNNWDMKTEKAHLTVGCYKNPNDELYNVISNIRSAPSCNVNQIGVSLTGERGVCLGILKVFDLNK